MTRLSCAIAARAVSLAGVVACIAGSVGPAGASTVSASSVVDLPHILAVFRVSDNLELDPLTSVAASIGGISLSVSRSTPGVSSASGTGVASLTNLLDFQILVSYDEYFLTEAFYLLDEPRLRASASAQWLITHDGAFVDGGSAAVATESCAAADLPCTDEVVDPGAWALDLFLDAGETAVFDISGSVRAALTPIPLPGSASLLLLALGVVAVGRRIAV